MYWEKPRNQSVSEAKVTSRLHIKEAKGRNMKLETKDLLSFKYVSQLALISETCVAQAVASVAPAFTVKWKV